MTDILLQGVRFRQGSSVPTFFFDFLVKPNQFQKASIVPLDDIEPPTFAGISALAIQGRGQLRVSWLPATDTSLPVHYQIFIKAASAVGLFSAANLIAMTDALQYDIFTTRDGEFLMNGQTYFVGVRAIDALGNRDGNVASLSAKSIGVMLFADTYKVSGAFSINTQNQFQGTLWCVKNSVLDSTINFGFASYQVFDRNGAAVAGMSESLISVGSNGQFQITPVASLLNKTLDQYLVKVTIQADGVERADYVPLIEEVPEYEVGGAFTMDEQHRLISSFYVSANDELVSGARLGTAGYQIVDREGNLVSGLSQSGITADANGIFRITPVASTLADDLTLYFAKVQVTVDGIVRTHYLQLLGALPQYEARGQFSINALNQFQASLWVTADGIVRKGGSLGTASFTVLDMNGNAVAGLAQSGITADANGLFHTTPISASLLSDLTHYSVKISIVVDGAERVSMRGFTLLGN